MASEPLVLGFDTSAAHCAAALLRGETVLASRLEEMSRGQAERLVPLLEEVLAEGGAAWAGLDAIGVGIGPGNFTGIRIAVSAARGLALGLEVPVVGVDGFEARAAEGTLPAVPAPRDQVYAALPGQAPRLMPRQEAEDAARDAGLACAPEASPAGIAEAIARIAAERFQTVTEPPAPLYLRAADAAPSSDVPPALIDE
ncbi:tRNA (adenosine(37)-N6)-threonylcarbamoyltransferase complex dimerization subunit type 1 TsaB [Leisingera sp. McT4-56]|uniref:tRNA (adenosine(37)-N6)-threonylcarbamoyltransferase complex dimerization subunit type 1 TsaB n=1 Tax=Leisingera sp. McT4-56 TaxID=2881255 RepID=UPI001CF82588|nr:tRNA (adenosine(37)-N6)-threonylcarbamoyltransferase complex dimerization subunit type 1 TsaB [Leisingera sp. McT4-56]MCB4457707.1 tRNA (adenosine(37)-N6)-threonylcarbamoyltransferase complex dimerization subunit type 1 TsaB [Leisingera sp. McT4-56]